MGGNYLYIGEGLYIGFLYSTIFFQPPNARLKSIPAQNRVGKAGLVMENHHFQVDVMRGIMPEKMGNTVFNIYIGAL